MANYNQQYNAVLKWLDRVPDIKAQFLKLDLTKQIEATTTLYTFVIRNFRQGISKFDKADFKDIIDLAASGRKVKPNDDKQYL